MSSTVSFDLPPRKGLCMSVKSDLSQRLTPNERTPPQQKTDRMGAPKQMSNDILLPPKCHTSSPPAIDAPLGPRDRRGRTRGRRKGLSRHSVVGLGSKAVCGAVGIRGIFGRDGMGDGMYHSVTTMD